MNLAGALQMGINTPLSTTKLDDLDVLHLIGEALPDGMSPRSFVLYQNICPPDESLSSGLVLPATAFTEEDGTFIDHAGGLHSIHKVVEALGSALPSWQILCRIAQKLDVPGFDFEDEAQIRAEMGSMDAVSADTVNVPPPHPALFPASHSDDHAYMGFPLRTLVAGLPVLYPEPALRTK